MHNKFTTIMEGNVSYSDVAAMVKGSEGCGNSWNNPMWLLWALMFGGGNGFGWGNRAGAAAGVEVNDRLNALQAQIANNQQTNTLGAGIAGNHEALHGVHGAIDMGFAGTNANINSASMTNALGQKDLQSAIQTCCCNNQTAILNQTNQLQSRIDQLANGTQQGFASLGYALSQQTNELNTNATANTQRILDHMCQSETQALRDKLAQASQNEQTAYLISQLKTTA